MTVETGISTFQVGTKRFRFKEPLMLTDEVVARGCCLTHKGLSLSACGKSWSECVGIIREELATLWEDYVMVPDDALTAAAVILKHRILEMVEGKIQVSEAKIKNV